MGLFDKLRKKLKGDTDENKGKNDIAENKGKDNTAENKGIETFGYDAITNECLRVYPNQTDPKCYSNVINWELGGDNPLREINVYDGGDYWHFVSFGLSELYEKVSDIKEISGYGMEFTLKLKKDNYEDEELEIKGICGILQTVARATFTSGEIFKPYEYLYTGQTGGIDVKMQSNITGFITIPDNDLKSINTPNGKVDFVEFIGATNGELLAVMEKKIDVKTLYHEINSDVTSYNRKSVR